MHNVIKYLINKRNALILCASLSLLISTRAQNNADSIVFPTTAKLQLQTGTLKSGYYFMSTRDTKNKELFISSSIMDNKKEGGLSTLSMNSAGTNKINVKNNKGLWEFVMKTDSTFYIKSVYEKKFLYFVGKENSTNISYEDDYEKDKTWKYEILPNGRIHIYINNRERCLGRDNKLKKGFRCYYPNNKDGSFDLSLYTLPKTTYAGSCTMPQQGQRLCFVADGKLKATNGADINKEDLLLNDGKVAPTDNLQVMIAEVLGSNTFQLKNAEGKYFDYNLQFGNTPYTWKISNGHLCTDEATTRYLCYDNGSWIQRNAEDADNMVNFLTLAEEPQKTTNKEGVCKLTGGWTSTALSNLNFDAISCLDLTAISLPKSSLGTLTDPQSNIPIFINEKDATVVPTSWHFVVICNEKENVLQDSQLTFIDKKPFYTDRTISVKEGQISYQRTNTATDQWQTLSLPFEATLEKGKLYECESIEGETLNFSEVKATESSKGYLVKPDNNGTLQLRSQACNIQPQTSNKENLLLPNFETLNITNENYYLLHPQLQNFMLAKAKSYLAPFRAYLIVDNNKGLKIRIRR